MKNLDIITTAVSLIIKAAILAARWSGMIRKRSLDKPVVLLGPLLSANYDAKENHATGTGGDTNPKTSVSFCESSERGLIERNLEKLRVKCLPEA